MFNPEAHFLRGYRGESSPEETQSAKPTKVWLGNTAYTRKKKERRASEKMNYGNISVSIAKQLNVMFSRYLKQLLETSLKTPIISVLARIELIGVEASPLKHNTNPLTHLYPTGIVVNETKNTLAISINGIVKVFPKSMYNFFIYAEGRKYFLIGPALRSDRRYTK